MAETSAVDRRSADASERHPLEAIEDRVLWLAMAMVDHANRVRPRRDGLKVGGHQASSASMATIMTALWFGALRAGDRVSVKPHAAPVLHAINFLLGSLDVSYMTRLREFHGLQSYPSRAKDPDPVDYSTGSVGLGATAPVWAAIARRYLDGRLHIGHDTGRQYSLLGDAELDEGACWEAVLDPMVSELGEVVWIVDLNRQSLDRVVPHLAAARVEAMFGAAGWQVLTVKYGRRLGELFTRPDGHLLRERIDGMGNAEYQRLLRCQPSELPGRLCADAPPALRRFVADIGGEDLHLALRNLGGHDPAALLDAFASIDDTRPTLVIAYTIKGWRLPTEGHPQNHSALLGEQEMRALAARLGASLDDPWRHFPTGSPEADLCAVVGARLSREPLVPNEPPPVPVEVGRSFVGPASTQQALGRTLLDLANEAPEVARRIVTASPDVSSSTNLGR